MSDQPVIRTRALTKRYGELRAVDAVDLEVAEGDVYGFLGANGSGKTTTVRMLLGLVLPTAGEVEVLGEPMPAARSIVLPQVGALVEGPGAYDHLSGRLNLSLLDAAGPDAMPRARSARRRIDEVLEQVGLDPADRRPVRAYSLGMRQRLGLGVRADAPAAAARAGRADQRAGPAGHQRDPHAAARAERRRAPRSSCPATCSPRSSRCARRSACSTAAGWSCRNASTPCCARPGWSRCTARTPAARRCCSATRSSRSTGERLLVRADDAAGLNRHLVSAGVRVARLGPYERDLEQVVLEASHVAPAPRPRRVEVLTLIRVELVKLVLRPRTWVILGHARRPADAGGDPAGGHRHRAGAGRGPAVPVRRAQRRDALPAGRARGRAAPVPADRRRRCWAATRSPARSSRARCATCSSGPPAGCGCWWPSS